MISLKTRRHFVIVTLLMIALVVFLAWLPQETRQAFVSGLLGQRTLVTLLLSFTLLTLSLVWSAGQKLDAWVFTLFNNRGRRPRWMDAVMWVATQLGNMFLALGIALYAWLNGNRRLTAEVLIGVLTLWLVVEMVKAFTDRARPFLILVHARLVGWRERGKSFPSGHTAQVFFLASLLAHHFRPSLAVSLGMYGVAAFVGVTRVYVGVHYPRDVIGGAILGVAWGILMVLIDGYYYGAVR